MPRKCAKSAPRRVEVDHCQARLRRHGEEARAGRKSRRAIRAMAPRAPAGVLMKTLLIVFHTTTGGTRQMAEAAARGASLAGPGIRPRLLHATETRPEDVLTADGYVFATPEMLASMAGLMKDFFERCYYPALDRITGRPYAMMICAGSDGTGAARQLERIVTGWRLRAVAEPLILCTHAQTPERILAPKTIPADDLKRCEEMGEALAQGLAMGIF
jgi:NAD(P)H-dependent FMN reductase